MMMQPMAQSQIAQITPESTGFLKMTVGLLDSNGPQSKTGKMNLISSESKYVKTGTIAYVRVLMDLFTDFLLPSWV